MRVIVLSLRRLALKIASYGLMHLVVAILVALAITRDWRLALAVGMIEPIFQTFAYTLHDRAWHLIERRRRLGGVEETAEAVAARLDVMDAVEQSRPHGHHGHSHGVPKSIAQIAVKSMTYGVMHLSVAITVAYVLTHDLRLALTIGLAEPLVQTGFFALHDRIWARIEARKRATPALVAANQDPITSRCA